MQPRLVPPEVRGDGADRLRREDGLNPERRTGEFRLKNRLIATLARSTVPPASATASMWVTVREISSPMRKKHWSIRLTQSFVSEGRTRKTIPAYCLDGSTTTVPSSSSGRPLPRQDALRLPVEGSVHRRVQLGRRIAATASVAPARSSGPAIRQKFSFVV